MNLPNLTFDTKRKRMEIIFHDLRPSVKPKSNQIISFDCLNCTSERYLKDIKQIKLENSNQIMITVMKI